MSRALTTWRGRWGAGLRGGDAGARDYVAGTLGRGTTWRGRWGAGLRGGDAGARDYVAGTLGRGTTWRGRWGAGLRGGDAGARDYVAGTLGRGTTWRGRWGAGLRGGDAGARDYVAGTVRGTTRASDSIGSVSSASSRVPVAVVAGLFVASLALRQQLLSIGPLLPLIRGDLDLSAAAAGLLTTIPVLCMGLFAPFGPRLAARLGPRLAFAACISLIAGFGVVRSVVPGVPLILLATFGVGLGIGIAGAIPSMIVAGRIAMRPALGTGAYASGIAAGSALAAALAIPLAVDGQWRVSLLALSLGSFLCVVRLAGPVARPRRGPAGVIGPRASPAVAVDDRLDPRPRVRPAVDPVLRGLGVDPQCLRRARLDRRRRPARWWRSSTASGC